MPDSITPWETTPRAAAIPKILRDGIREAISDPKMRNAFVEIEAWGDDVVAALNIAAEALDRMADALEAIEQMPYEKFETKGDYAAFIRDLARNGRFPK